MKKTIFCLFALFPCLFCTNSPLTAQPDTVRIGAYVLDIYDVEMSANSFSSQFWVWFNYKNKELKPLDNLEIANAKNKEPANKFDEVKNGIQWSGEKYTATIKQEWDIRNFPFDKQKMTIEFEQSDPDYSQLVYVADTANTKLLPSLKLTNWEIDGYDMVADSKSYNSTFGDPVLKNGSSTYAHAALHIYIKRHGWGLFLSLFTGMYVAFFISCLVFFIDAHHVDPRFGLSVGGLFAAVGNKYIVDSVLPQSTTFTLVDLLHSITYFFLLMCIILSVISLWMWGKGKERQSARFDYWARILILSAYMLLNIIFVWQASSGQ